MKDFTKPEDEVLKKTLSEEEYRVTQKHGTEKPFDNRYWNHHGKGIYVDVVSGEPLFSSNDKFDSKSGWPSFIRPIYPDHLVIGKDQRYWMTRNEVRSKSADSHLGHLLKSDKVREGEYYCINSSALRFIPAEQLDLQGYGEFKALFERLERAIFGAGCFWSVEEAFRQLPGVIATRTGFAGGDCENPTYEEVCTGKTDHTEVVEVTFDPAQIDYRSLLNVFFETHSPFGGKSERRLVKRQYRSLIIYFDEKQKNNAREKIRSLSGPNESVSTELTPFSAFYPAEERHQRYVLKMSRYREGTRRHP